MLEVAVAKKLPHFAIDVAFSCGTGELVVLTGPSGAGKTTLIRMIAGLERPDTGTVRLNGECWVDVERKLFVPPRKRRVGFVFQEYTLFPHLNVYGNVTFAADDRKEAERLLKLFGIRHLKDRMVWELSGGERQRCAICQALARRPKVLLMDEPFSALDSETRRALRTELKTLKTEWSIPIVHITHDLDEACFLGDSILPIVQGKITPGWLESRLRGEEESRAATVALRRELELKRRGG